MVVVSHHDHNIIIILLPQFRWSEKLIDLHVISNYAVPYPPQGRSWKIPRGRGDFKIKILEAKYEAKLEFPGGTGVQKKKPSMQGVWIFSGTALWCTMQPGPGPPF